MSDPKAFTPSVSPWRRMLPHFELLTSEHVLDGFFNGLRDFVAEACEVPALADRFVFPSTINMSIFRSNGPVDLLEEAMPMRFIVSPRGPAKIHLGYYPAEANESSDSWIVPPHVAIGIIAAEFNKPSECAASIDSGRSATPTAPP